MSLHSIIMSPFFVVYYRTKASHNYLQPTRFLNVACISAVHKRKKHDTDAETGSFQMFISCPSDPFYTCASKHDSSCTCS